MIWVSVNFDFFIQPPGGEKMPESSTYWVSTDRGSLRVYLATKRYFTYTANAWDGNDWASDSLDSRFRFDASRDLNPQLGAGFLTRVPAVSPFLPYSSTEAGLLGISPDVRYRMTGSQNVYRASDFVLQAFDRFNTRVDYWREVFNR